VEGANVLDFCLVGRTNQVEQVFLFSTDPFGNVQWKTSYLSTYQQYSPSRRRQRWLKD